MWERRGWRQGDRRERRCKTYLFRLDSNGLEWFLDDGRVDVGSEDLTAKHFGERLDLLLGPFDETYQSKQIRHQRLVLCLTDETKKGLTRNHHVLLEPRLEPIARVLYPHERHDRQLVHVSSDIPLEFDRPHPLLQHLRPRGQESGRGEVLLIEGVEERDELDEGMFAEGWGGELVGEGGEEGIG
jgi:hypothetical protein